jgi:hypothetical protein
MSSEQQQDLVLTELSALLNTMNSIEEVLQDIERLTSPANPRSVYSKQENLLVELRQWAHVNQKSND